MHFLEQAAVFLLAALLLVPLARLARLGSVLGYLVAGMLIGPFGLRLAGEVEATLRFAELGVVLLLFLIGLELDLRRLWLMRRRVFGLGGAQVALSAAALGAAAIGAGFDWRAALVVGFGLAMSSTALVLSSLAERGQLASPQGRDAFAVLLFQDLSVIVALALLPLLGRAGGEPALDLVAALKGLGAIAVVIVVSRYVVCPALMAVARWGGREMFTAAALLVVIGAALVMEWIGLSMSLGAFLAGVLLADTEFRHELEADIEPFKGLLMGLFFISVGMSANLGLVASSPLLVLGLAAGFMAAKALIAAAVALAAGARGPAAARLGTWLSQGGEFAFVLFAAAAALGVLDRGTGELLVLAVTASMLLSPPLFALESQLHARWMERHSTPEYDLIDDPAKPVVIAGFGRVGQVVSRMLRMAGVQFTALELSYQQVDFVRRFGSKVYYGDASRLELLHAAKVGEAKLFVLAIDDVDASLKVAELVRRHFPQLPILARARNRTHYFRLRDLGVRMIFREAFPASVEMGRLALLRLGLGVATTERAVSLFRQHDEEMLEAQYQVHHDEARFVETSRRWTEQLKEAFETDPVLRSSRAS